MGWIDMSNGDQLFACDLHVGLRWSGTSRRLTKETFAGFADLTGDAHPIHYDQAYAAKTRFGRPVAHGLLLVGMTALGAAPIASRLRASMVALISQDANFLAPAMIDDIVTPTFECSGIEATREDTLSRVSFAVTLTNQDGNALLAGSHTYLLVRTPPQDGPAS